MDTHAKLEIFCDESVAFVRLTTAAGHAGWGQTPNQNAVITATIFSLRHPWQSRANSLWAWLGCGSQPRVAAHGQPTSERGVCM